MTTDIELRAVTDADLPALFENQRDPASAAMAGVPVRDRETFLAHYAKTVADPRAVRRAIVVDGELVGDVMSWEQDGVREIGYRVAQEHWGRGIATAALTAFLHELTDRPLAAHVVKHNVGSVRVLEKCGFTRIPGEELPADADPEELSFVLTGG